MTTVYTPNEEKLLKILKRKKGKPMTSLEIVDQHYKKDERPKFARQSVVCVLNSLIPKTKRNRKKDGFVLCKTDRAGPHPNKYWLE
jgi:hypothetical protein